MIYYFLNDSLLQDFDDALYNYAIDVAQTIEIGPKNDLLFPPLHVDEGKIFPFSSGTALIMVRHKSGEILIQTGRFGNLKFPYKNQINKILKGDDSSYSTLTKVEGLPEAEADEYRLVTFPLDSVTAPTLFLQIAVPMTTFAKQLDRLKLIASVGLPTMLLLAIFLGFYFSARALNPVKEIIAKTKNIDASNLKERVPLPASRDDIRELAETQNQMLERIEKAFSSQEKFVADASHQIMTPLTILRGELESKLRQRPEEKEFIGSLLQEVEKLTRISQDMLLLARIDAGTESLHSEKLNIDELLIDVIGRLQKIAFSRNISLKFDIEGDETRHEILGDEDLLSNLFSNLIENAIKYSPSQQVVTVRLTWGPVETKVEIIDQGSGIPEEKKEMIFQRFSRLNPSDGRKGFGLGLAIAQKIAQLHHFDLSVQNHPEALGRKVQSGSIFKLVMKNI